MSNPQAYLTVAVQAAHAAGAIHLKYLGKVAQIRSKSTYSDLVTEADSEAEQAIRNIIAAAYPDHAVLGEEEGQQGESEFRWIVDPLDGTVNYAHGYPVFCASVGLEIAGKRTVGAIFDPTRNELFTALLGHGAFLNGQPIQVSRTPSLTTPALVSTGFPYDTTGDRNLVHVSKLLKLGVPVRRPGAAALDLCNVACGRMDAFWEYGLKPWDSAAGSLLVEEAGGKISDAAGTHTPYGEMMVATNGLLHAELLGILQG